MRKVGVVAVLAGTALLAGGALLVGWVSHSVEAEWQERLRHLGIDARLQREFFPWPRLRVAGMHTVVPVGSTRLDANVAEAELLWDALASLRERCLCFQVTLRRPRIELGPDDVAADPPDLLRWVLAAARSKDIPPVDSLPAGLSLVVLFDGEVRRTDALGQATPWLRLYEGEWQRDSGGAWFCRLAGDYGASARRFDLAFRLGREVEGVRAWEVRGRALVGESTAVELEPLVLVVDQRGSLRSASGTGRLAGGRWTLRLEPLRQNGGELKAREWLRVSLRLDGLRLKALVDDFFLDYRRTVAGQVRADVDLDLPADAFSSTNEGWPLVEEWKLHAAAGGEHIRLAHHNLLYGLLNAALRAAIAGGKGVPDELRAAFPELLVEARTRLTRLAARIEFTAGRLRVSEVEALGPAFSLQGDGTWDIPAALVDFRFSLRLEEPLRGAFCRVGTRLRACAADAPPDEGLRFVWQGMLGETWPEVRLEE